MYIVWMIDYLNAIFPEWGVFESEDEANKWIDKWGGETKRYYKPFRLTVNTELARNVATDAPNSRYINQR